MYKYDMQDYICLIFEEGHSGKLRLAVVSGVAMVTVAVQAIHGADNRPPSWFRNVARGGPEEGHRQGPNFQLSGECPFSTQLALGHSGER